MEERAAIVELRNLFKSYRRGGQILPVLRDITLDIREGDFMALMGPSGSGKSTLLNLIAGLDQADSGTIHVAGVDITTLSESELAEWRALNVGFIFQFYNLIPVLTAFENVELPLILTDLSKKERREHVATALNLVKLEDRMDHYPGQLSGGQQQRVAIARAMVTDPAILVADEPTGDLDRTSAEEVLSLMERLSREAGKTIIMVTHDPRAARKARSMRYLEKGVLAGAPEISFSQSCLDTNSAQGSPFAGSAWPFSPSVSFERSSAPGMRAWRPLQPTASSPAIPFLSFSPFLCPIWKGFEG